MKNFKLTTSEKLFRVHNWMSNDRKLEIITNCSETGFQLMKIKFGETTMEIRDVEVVETLYAMLASFMKLRDEVSGK